ncbi:GDSL-type esterase/lipase family protein [Catellatospora tritici]|uniref:GDSL-type esterase/lipase family protein n=1 Tax=Catellatospora tritici TaxID=2851566 RepID=UPI001C2DE2FB|nr:GDSL-type esterase/lipase family protein [Catellatospora tritici]MBV1855938.1 discoidin domain-containing protein [Catellatospora tritici]
MPSVPRLATRLAALLAALLSLAFLPAPAEAAVTSRPIRIMPLGDSITWGVGSPSTSSYRAALWQRLVNQAGYAVDFVGSQQSGSLPDTDNEGHSGWRIDQIAASATGWLNTYQPDVVLLHIGTNDMNQNYDVANAPARLGSLIDQILAARPTATVLIAKIVPALDATIQARINTFNAAVPGIVAARGARAKLVDLSVLGSADLADTLHPNDAGYARMAVRWYSGLESVLGDGRDHPLLSTAFEATDTAPTWRDSIAAAINVGGYCCALTAMEASTRAELAHSGAGALMYSGSDNSATQSYSYARIFAADTPLTSRSVLSYWIYPQQANGTFVGVDLQFSDGSALRDTSAVDQYGVRAHPQFQGEGGHLVVNQWNLVRINLGGLAGRTVTRVDLGFDRPTGTGTFRGYLDDLSLSDEGGTFPGSDLALGKPTTGSAACVAAEAPAKATDGVVSGNSKWCSGVAGASLQVDLGSVRTVRRFVIRHASAGGEALALNTKAFRIEGSSDGGTWTTLVTVTANADGVTTHPVNATARYVRLVVQTPSQTTDAVTRVYSFEVAGA